MLRSLIGLLLTLGFLPGSHGADSADVAFKLRGDLAAVLEASAPDAMVPVLVVLSEQLDPAVAQRLAQEDHARTKIGARLKHLAGESQRGLLTHLSQLGPQAVSSVRSAWLVNAVALTATPATVRQLARLDEVAWIGPNPQRPAFIGPVSFEKDALIVPTGSPVFPAEPPLPPPAPPVDASWGVIDSRALEVNEQLRITGDGVVVAVIDSGICYEHVDIAERIWINPGENLDGDDEVMDADDLNGIDDDNNGFIDDLIGWDFDRGDNDPDGFAHGSHVSGTVAGDGRSGFRSGVAPGARIMPLKVGSFASDEMDAWQAIQYAADNGADVINLSMGWRHRWSPDRVMWRQLAQMARAMGTTMVVAAGNDARIDPPPDDVRTPGDVPEVITAGATNPFGWVAYFSSRGPSTWQDIDPFNDHPLPPGLIKPDIAAPGVDVISHYLCEGTTDSSGTSMATPHVAGAVALLLEADPTLDTEQIRALLQQTAIDIGEPGMDNDSGAGRLDAFAAVSAALRGLRFESLRVDDAAGNANAALDPGELSQLYVTLTNVSEQPTGVLQATLVSRSGVLEVESARARFASIPPGQQGEVQRGFTVRVVGDCADEEEMQLDLQREDGSIVRVHFSVRVGRPQQAALFADDGESDRGWTVTGDAAAGDWVRDVPRGTTSNGQTANPSQDASPAGERAWITGNSGRSSRDDDVDLGQTVLASPVLDVSAFLTLNLEFSHWLYREGRPALPANEFLAIDLSDDEGETWVTAHLQGVSTGGWQVASRDLTELVSLRGTLILRVRAADIGHDQLGGAADSVLEAGIDEIRLSGERLVCEP